MRSLRRWPGRSCRPRKLPDLRRARWTCYNGSQIIPTHHPVTAFFLASSAFAADKPCLLVLTDIGGPDDQQSMIRLMVHANEFEIEGRSPPRRGPGQESKKLSGPS